jgi:hypothetical protein
MAAYLIQDWILDDGSLVADLAMGEGNFAGAVAAGRSSL